MQVILMSGPSGCGKSTRAKSLGGSLTITCSADDYFVDPIEGTYNFDPSKLSEAHGACLRKFATHLIAGIADTIIVDNTNLTALELAPYVQLAAAYGATVEIVTIRSATVEQCAARNTHNVPHLAIERMHAILAKREIPPYWKVNLTNI